MAHLGNFKKGLSSPTSRKTQSPNYGHTFLLFTCLCDSATHNNMMKGNVYELEGQVQEH